MNDQSRIERLVAMGNAHLKRSAVASKSTAPCPEPTDARVARMAAAGNAYLGRRSRA